MAGPQFVTVMAILFTTVASVDISPACENHIEDVVERLQLKMEIMNRRLEMLEEKAKRFEMGAHDEDSIRFPQPWEELRGQMEPRNETGFDGMAREQKPTGNVAAIGHNPATDLGAKGWTGVHEDDSDVNERLMQLESAVRVLTEGDQNSTHLLQ